MSDKFKALIVEEMQDGIFTQRMGEKNIDELPIGEVLVKVAYAALNFKDSLSAFGHKGITRKYPHTPGVDASGVVAQCSDGTFHIGDEVIVTGFDLGMNTAGAFAEYIRVPSAWVVPKPRGFDLRQSMAMGTAAFTAALGLYKMELLGQKPADGPILVTGASGGVGSLAVAILAKAGYEVIATSGKADAADYLKGLGATRVEPREFANDQSGRPLLKTLWAGAIDTVGGNTLSTCLKACARNGSVAATGLVDTFNLSTTVYPFLLNGVNLLGVDSAECNMRLRLKIWQKLAQEWSVAAKLEAVTVDVNLDGIMEYMHLINQGKTRGRVVCSIG